MSNIMVGQVSKLPIYPKSDLEVDSNLDWKNAIIIIKSKG